VLESANTMASGKKTILGVFAHPDDESMGTGATFAKYAALGHRVCFVTATDGGAGRLHKERPKDNRELRKLRRRETAAAAKILGVEFLGFMGWEDRGLENLNILDIEREIVKVIRKEKADVVVTFHGSGISYHPDHRVIALACTGAFLGAGDAAWYLDDDLASLPPYRPSKLYSYTALKSRIETIEWPRRVYVSADEEVSTLIDTKATADVKWKAIQAHDTQRDGPPFQSMYDAGLFEVEGFLRIFPSWRPGDPRETDLLEGL
jgi:LmbE family N-acetylglucosaminyl deacetylase